MVNMYYKNGWIRKLNKNKTKYTLKTFDTYLIYDVMNRIIYKAYLQIWTLNAKKHENSTKLYDIRGDHLNWHHVNVYTVYLSDIKKVPTYLVFFINKLIKFRCLD